MSHESERIYRMSLHDKINLGRFIQIVRVAGGWIYQFSDTSSNGVPTVSVTFVPFNNEFQNEGQK